MKSKSPKALLEKGNRLASCLLKKRLDFSGFQPPATCRSLCQRRLVQVQAAQVQASLE